MSEPRKPSILGHAVWTLLTMPLKLGAIVLMVLVPLVGGWVASSLAVFHNSSLPLAIGAACLMFPVLPLTWELLGSWRFARKHPGRKPFLTRLDRLVLRTLTLNALFIAGLLLYSPTQAFTALSTRGDWMLEGREGSWAEQGRRGVFQAADTLEWLYKRFKENPYAKYDKRGGELPDPGAPSSGRPDQQKGTADGTKPDDPTATTQPSTTQPSTGPAKPASQSWPAKGRHPALAQISAADEASIAALGRFFSENTQPGYERAKAIHDWVASNIRYDVAALRSNNIPPQDAATTLRSRSSVCAGYAALFEALCREAGLEAVMVVGHGRERSGAIDGVGHAWNAVKIDGRWRLVDTTWDAGHVGDKEGFQPSYRTVYFNTPPDVFSLDHFPDDPRWQLRERPLTRGEFIRQPMMRPAFYAAGLRLLAPQRSQVSVTTTATIVVDNPVGKFILASHKPEGASGPERRCQTTHGKRTVVRCTFSSAGEYNVTLCVSSRRYSTYLCLGDIKVNADP